MRFPQVAEVRAYWDALRDGRLVPYRSEVDPRGIERALEYAFVLERVAPRVARFRLAGAHLNALMGMEVRGMPLSTFFTPKTHVEIGMIQEEVFSGPNTAELTLTAETGLGRPAMEAKLIILPLRSDLGDVSRALGCLMTEGPLGRVPRRFAITGCDIRPIAEGMPQRRMPPAMTVHGGFSEPRPTFDNTGAPQPRTRSHLRLVVSDK